MQLIAPEGAPVEFENTDEEINKFLQSERRIFERERREISPCLEKEKSRKGKEKEENIKISSKQLKEKQKKEKQNKDSMLQY